MELLTVRETGVSEPFRGWGFLPDGKGTLTLLTESTVDRDAYPPSIFGMKKISQPGRTGW